MAQCGGLAIECPTASMSATGATPLSLGELQPQLSQLPTQQLHKGNPKDDDLSAPPPVPDHTVFYYSFDIHQSTTQAQQHFVFHQHPPVMNGMNGANMGGGMPVPTPAGHQAELNYIYSMVEELSRQLADNRRVTEDIVSGLGRVRNKAKSQNLANDEVIDAAADDINGKTFSRPIRFGLKHHAYMK